MHDRYIDSYISVTRFVFYRENGSIVKTVESLRTMSSPVYVKLSGLLLEYISRPVFRFPAQHRGLAYMIAVVKPSSV